MIPCILNLGVKKNLTPRFVQSTKEYYREWIWKTKYHHTLYELCEFFFYIGGQVVNLLIA